MSQLLPHNCRRKWLSAMFLENKQPSRLSVVICKLAIVVWDSSRGPFVRPWRTGLKCVEQESPTFLKLKHTSLVPINQKCYQFDTHFWNKKMLSLSLIMLSLIKLMILIYVNTMTTFILFSEQAREWPTLSVQATWCPRIRCW